MAPDRRRSRGESRPAYHCPGRRVWRQTEGPRASYQRKQSQVTYIRPISSVPRWLCALLLAALLLLGGGGGVGCAGLGHSRQAQSLSTDGRSIVPIRPNRAGAPLVPVRGKTNAAWEMMLDTGAPSVVVSPEVAQREGWPVRKGEMFSVDAIGNRTDVGVATAKLLRVGGTAATFRDFDTMVMSPKSLKFGEGTGDGALGLMLFH